MLPHVFLQEFSYKSISQRSSSGIPSSNFIFLDNRDWILEKSTTPILTNAVFITLLNVSIELWLDSKIVGRIEIIDFTKLIKHSGNSISGFGGSEFGKTSKK